MKKKTVVLAIEDDLLVDLTFHNVSASFFCGVCARAQGGPQTIYSIHKQVTNLRGFKYTRYASVNKRIKTLAVLGFVNEAAAKITKAGFTAFIYDIYTKAYLALLLNSIVMDDLLLQMGDSTASAVLGALSVAIIEGET